LAVEFEESENWEFLGNKIPIEPGDMKPVTIGFVPKVSGVCSLPGIKFNGEVFVTGPREVKLLADNSSKN
jgi:hypothetical protein